MTSVLQTKLSLAGRGGFSSFLASHVEFLKLLLKKRWRQEKQQQRILCVTEAFSVFWTVNEKYAIIMWVLDPSVLSRVRNLFVTLLFSSSPAHCSSYTLLLICPFPWRPTSSLSAVNGSSDLEGFRFADKVIRPHRASLHKSYAIEEHHLLQGGNTGEARKVPYVDEDHKAKKNWVLTIWAVIFTEFVDVPIQHRMRSTWKYSNRNMSS